MAMCKLICDSRVKAVLEPVTGECLVSEFIRRLFSDALIYYIHAGCYCKRTVNYFNQHFTDRPNVDHGYTSN